MSNKYSPLIDDIQDSLEEQEIPANIIASPAEHGGYTIKICIAPEEETYEQD